MLRMIYTWNFLAFKMLIVTLKFSENENNLQDKVTVFETNPS